MNNITVRKADRELLPGLEEVWRECFYDDSDYIRYFYACNFDRIETFAAMDGAKVIAILHLIPASIDGRAAYYGYAMGILPQYRGTGVFPYLHRTIFDLIRERDAAYFLKPANDRLAAYYTTQGLTEGFYLKQVVYKADRKKLKKTEISLTDINTEEYRKIRDDCFDRKGYVKWDAAALDYAVVENIRSGGFAKKITVPEGEFIIFGSFSDETAAVRETTMPGPVMDNYGGAIAAYLKADRLEAELPVYSSTVGGVIKPVGMIYNMDKESEGYFNLPLD